MYQTMTKEGKNQKDSIFIQHNLHSPSPSTMLSHNLNLNGKRGFGNRLVPIKELEQSKGMEKCFHIILA